MLYFTADSHFCDEVTLKRAYRPFDSIEEMDNTIINNWNRIAKKDDIIYHLGDFTSYTPYIKNIYENAFKKVKEINAKVILISGNNETRIMNEVFEGSFDRFKKYLLDLGFYDVIKDSLYLNLNNNKIFLNHYPLAADKFCFNLFGHIHNLSFAKKFGINVGVDCNHYRLFSEANVLKFLSDIKNNKYDENVFC